MIDNKIAPSYIRNMHLCPGQIEHRRSSEMADMKFANFTSMYGTRDHPNPNPTLTL